MLNDVWCLICICFYSFVVFVFCKKKIKIERRWYIIIVLLYICIYKLYVVKFLFEWKIWYMYMFWRYFYDEIMSDRLLYIMVGVL